jgi:Protein of unknown function DUF262
MRTIFQNGRKIMQGKLFDITPAQQEAANEQIDMQRSRIDYYITEYSTEHLANKMRSEEYVIPSYQREFTWEPGRKSRFIESLIMNLPIPFIFFWEMPDGKLEIVDGSQRLRTIEEFLLGGLRLGELETLTHVSGFTFEDLPEAQKRKIRNRSIRGIVLNEHADAAARMDMFERINTGSKIANTAEIRRGALAGPFMDMAIRLATDARLTRLAPLPDKSKKERGYEELVTRFFAYGDGLANYRDRPSDFIFDYAKAQNDRFRQHPSLAESYEKRFLETLEFIEKVFPHGFRKTPGAKTTYRARFEGIAIGSYLALRDEPRLKGSTVEQLDVASWVGGDEFTSVTGSDGANARARLEGRIEFVRERLVNA